MNPIHQIQSLQKAEPFQPFSIIMTSGTVYPVDFKEDVHVTRSGSIMYFNEHQEPNGEMSASGVWLNRSMIEAVAGKNVPDVK